MRARHLVALAALGLAAALWSGSLVLATGNLEITDAGNTAIFSRIWNNISLPVVWRYHDPDTQVGCYSSANAPVTMLQAANQAGFDAWQADPDSRIAFSYGGVTTVRNVGADGVNVVTFCDSTVLGSNQGFLAATPTTALRSPITVVAGGGCPAGQGLLDANGPPPPAGFCFPTGTYPVGTIIDGDIMYNTFGTTEEDFSTNHAIGTFDVQATATHEIGHFFGLSHDPLSQTTMFPFIDDEPASDGMGQRVLKRSDLGTSGRYYPEASYGANLGSITGFITLDGADADGVHVAAIDPVTMLGVAGRFSLSRFESSLSLGPEGPDFAAQGGGFYRIDGLPPGNYYVYVEYFDNSEFISGRLANRYNTTVANSNVSPGGGAGALGFLPALTEFYNAGESGNGGNGVDPGAAADNSDAASLVPVAAGAVTSNINIAINIEPVNGQVAAARQNPTTRSTLVNDAFASATDRITGFLLDGGGDDFYGIRFPAGSLPLPPYNVAEGLWLRAGLSTMPMPVSLAFAEPGFPTIPDLDTPVLSTAGRVLSGGPNGSTVAGDFVDVRDQFNVTVNQSQDVFVIIHQPDAPFGIQFLTQGFFALVDCPNTACSAAARVGRTLVTENGGSNWFTITNADLFYDLIVEQDPPVMITSAVPNNMEAGTTGDILINGFGFHPSAAVDFGPDIIVNSVMFLSPQQLQVNITIVNTGATAPTPVSVKVINPDVVFPNVARVLTVLPVLDNDGDGTPDATDCAPADGTLETPASVVTNVQVAEMAGTAVVSWTSQDGSAGSATQYDVISGDPADLKPDAGFASAVCAIDNHGDTPYMDAVVLLPNQIRYWLVKACNACNVGGCTYGDGESFPDPRDALDAAPPCP